MLYHLQCSGSLLLILQAEAIIWPGEDSKGTSKVLQLLRFIKYLPLHTDHPAGCRQQIKFLKKDKPLFFYQWPCEQFKHSPYCMVLHWHLEGKSQKIIVTQCSYVTLCWCASVYYLQIATKAVEPEHVAEACFKNKTLVHVLCLKCLLKNCLSVTKGKTAQ